ncbi:phosphatidylinositol-binding protein SCS2 [Sugiyamaella lignohabitans]|uniref:Phosphatidylinositol-binding protein SCS2 n=1 Tax=Sugiyamaella lignohabitans TaxID=796027 RepID=A0A167E5N5_9ASCO|nr:phosphatidylinositol-binding protein SCS2 [Sugiyamaella lignohabitans]ANB13672.1 phosphatidylinositol-binding protein SCS2 [Sugiyamaella lignohabitans]
MDISPEVLVFHAPFSEQATKPLVLKNTSDRKLAYKIKTTAPKLYCVRPNASVIEAGQTIEVSIIRQAKDQPKPTEKSKDKFLVLTAPVSDEILENSDISKLWATLEETSKDTIVNKKIKVNYEFGTDSTGSSGSHHGETGAATSGSVGSGSLSSAATGTSESGDSSRSSGLPVNSHASALAAATSQSEGAGNTSIIDPSQYGTPLRGGHSDNAGAGSVLGGGSSGDGAGSSPVNATAAGIVAAAAGGAATGSSLSNGSSGESTLKSRNIPSSADTDRASQRAQEQISSQSKELKAAAAANSSSSTSGSANEPGFKSSQPGSSTAVRQQPSSGVPLHLVLALALVAFFIGWKLF